MASSKITNAAGERLDLSFHPGLKKQVLVILGHGVTGNKDRPLLLAIAQGLAEKDWPCLRLSFSGNGESGGRFEDSCISKGVADLQAVLDTVPDYAAPIYIGHSMGGAVGVIAAASDVRLCGLVTLAGMAHTADFVKREFGEVVPGQGDMWDEPGCPLSQAYVDDLTAIGSTLEASARVSQPWLLIHGLEDDIIPPGDSRDLFAATSAPKQLLEIPGAGHTFDDQTYPQLVTAIDQWLIRYFG